MNEIESKFYEAFMKIQNRFTTDKNYARRFPFTIFYIKPQEVVGIYKVDFLYNDCVIEIDGHDTHKTKEQREYDYMRERYLMKKGYKIIRFMGTEVFLDPQRCVLEMMDIASQFYKKEDDNWSNGFEAGIALN